MIAVRPQVAAESARQHFERGWWSRLRRRRSEPCDATPDGPTLSLPRLECVYLPYYRVIIESAGPQASQDVATTVEAHAGTFSLFDPTRVTLDPAADGLTFPPKLSIDAAVDIARHGLELCAQSSRTRHKRIKVGRAKQVDVLHYPYWVYYHARRRGAIDIKVLDAITGTAPGPKIKMSILTALITRSQSKDAPPLATATCR